MQDTNIKFSYSSICIYLRLCNLSVLGGNIIDKRFYLHNGRTFTPVSKPIAVTRTPKMLHKKYQTYSVSIVNFQLNKLKPLGHGSSDGFVFSTEFYIHG